jgi:pyrimidine operon attenuation protein/uracil phosphoribosyltransferase
MQKSLLFDKNHLGITIKRLCHQLMENHDLFENSVILGLQPRGIFFAERIAAELNLILSNKIQIGYLDTTFYRDDFRRRPEPLRPNATSVPFIIEDKKVIIVDDVLYTGRSVRAAMDAMIAFGRPSKVELLVLIDRMYSRDIPVQANYVGMKVNTLHSQRILVELKEQGKEEDNIWMIDNE